MDIIQTISIFSSFVVHGLVWDRYKIPAAQPKENLELSNRKSGSQLGFLVRIGDSCTGTLIHQDWVITAVHCLKHTEEEIIIDKNGDKIMNLTNSDAELIIQKPVGGTRVPEDQLWNKPIRLKKNRENKNVSGRGL